MRRTTIVTAFTAIALAALTACTTAEGEVSDSASAPAAPSSPASATISSGMPPKPTGQTRTDLLAALRKVNPVLVVDEEKALSNARNQCSSINGGSTKVDWAAQQRFGTSEHEVSEAEAKAINTAIAEYCATA